MRYVKLMTILMLLLSLGGCATIFGDNQRTVTVNSNPQNATVYLNNQPAGATPNKVVLNDIWSTNLIQVTKPGYQSVTTAVNSQFQPVGLWNILFWPGFIVDAISGDMMKIPADQRNINVNLAKNS